MAHQFRNIPFTEPTVATRCFAKWLSRTNGSASLNAIAYENANLN